MGADPTWPNRARYSVPCAVTPGSGGGGGAAGTHSARERAAPVRSERERVCFCRVFSLSVSLLFLFLFPLFAVLLNCPYPDPPVSACFFRFSSARRQGEGRPRGAFVASGSQNQNMDKAGTSSCCKVLGSCEEYRCPVHFCITSLPSRQGFQHTGVGALGESEEKSEGEPHGSVSRYGASSKRPKP